jgi:hypothetical protein
MLCTRFCGLGVQEGQGAAPPSGARNDGLEAPKLIDSIVKRGPTKVAQLLKLNENELFGAGKHHDRTFIMRTPGPQPNMHQTCYVSLRCHRDSKILACSSAVREPPERKAGRYSMQILVKQPQMHINA